MRDPLVLSEDEALELLAFLVSAARLLLDEPVDYGPMRLLSAAQRLSGAAAPRASEATRAVLQGLAEEIPRGLRGRIQDRDGYAAFVDEACRTVAAELARRAGREALG